MNVAAAGTGKSAPPDQAQAEAQKAQLARLAHEFEAMFLSEMLRGMRESMLSDEQDEGLGNETMTDTFDSELGLSLSKSGGLGLATLMLQAMTKQAGSTGSESTPAAAATAYTTAAAPLPTTAPSSAVVAGADSSPLRAAEQLDPVSLRAAAPGPVTSPFGWRADPFTGKATFHAGTDVRMAYGHDVQAVASGRVTSVGDRQGYGLTVVIDHGDGLETRYAHLSGATVREGESVEAGQTVARSGNSGRSTAPHLHLEARQNGRAVDMASLLKVSGDRADSYEDRSYVRSGHED